MITSAGTPVSPKLSCALPPGSKASGKVRRRLCAKTRKRSGVSFPTKRSLAARTNSMSSLRLKSERTAAISGSSAMQGAQIVEKKSMTRIFHDFAPVGAPLLRGTRVNVGAEVFFTRLEERASSSGTYERQYHPEIIVSLRSL